MSPRGKQSDKGYVSISGRVPLELRKQAKHKQIDTNITTDNLLEQLLRAWVNGEVALSLPEATEAAPQPSPVSPKPTKPKTPKASPPGEATQLATLLEQLGISQNELARRLDISSQTMSRYVSGKRRTPPEVLQAARQLLEPTEGE
jgi:DNA-binding transcriptional regulator YiaG